MHFASLNDITIHYAATGLGSDKPVLVFANSLGTDFRIWDDVVEALSGRFAIVRYDKRGHGLSELGSPPYSMDDHAGDLAALLDHLHISKAIVCGLSIGGQIALQLHADRPDLVGALIFSNTAAKIGDADFWNARIAAISENGLGSVADGVLERWFTPAFRSPDNPHFVGYKAMLTRQPVAGYTGSCAAIAQFDMREHAKNIALPTLCIVGDQDGATPPDLVEDFARSIRGARFEVIAGAGHIPCVETPEKFVALLDDFLSTLNRG